ncbi:TorF family putative porin [Halorhodospira halochloris]|uniref:TorF family putative porin n=1 Tax=Halorhodospira halochloris TaxID=1052 RepID=UPI001EE79F49|nr:TorF family putative porin [Halorhodospira halochloris]MCG5530303.1 TorF family putative porin [Halorhodospira halochloris]
MKRSLPLLTASGIFLGLSQSASAGEELGAGLTLSSNVAITSNYVFRGATESDEEPSVQGGFDFAHESGAYLGTWAASVAGYGGGEVELDYFAGYGFDVTDTIWADVGIYYYGYPDADGDPDTIELYAGLGTAFGDIEGDFYIHFSDDYFDENESVYLETNWTMPIAHGFYGMAHLGYLNLLDADDEVEDDAYDILIGAGYEYGSLDLSLAFTYADDGDDDEDYLFFTIARDF